jgi:hypothetical protein
MYDPSPPHDNSPQNQPYAQGGSYTQDRSYGSQETVSRAWDSALQEVRALTGDYVMPSRQWFVQLPDINRWLLGGGGLCVALGLFFLIGVPLLSYANSSAQAVIFPYTAEGKRQTCLSNLQQLSAAIAQYRDDYDDQFPVAEYSTNDSKGGQRKTWTALLRDRGADDASFTCPTSRAGSSDGQAISSYGFNPVLFGQTGNEGGLSTTVTLADRGTAHDTILLPPFATWPVVPEGKNAGNNAGNFDFRHGDKSGNNQAALLYGDGHADTLAAGDWTGQAATWGGDRVFTIGMERLETHYPVLKQITGSSPKAFRNQKTNLRQALEQLHVLQQQSRGNSVEIEDVEKRLWKGAGILRALGDGALERQLYADLLVQSLQLVKQAGEWKPLEDEGGENLSFTLRFLSAWRVETQNDGRYRTTYFRSPSPYVEVLVEHGTRNQPTDATVIDFTGMEDGLKEKYGTGYKRIQLGYGTLGGREVSLWECELKKSDGPKLRKRYFGYSTMWNSTIVVCTAPANSFKEWESTFEQMQDSFEFRDN